MNSKRVVDKLFAVFAAFMLAVVFSWLPWLAYSVVASVVTILPAAEWMQITFFTWLVLSVFLWFGVD